MGYRKVSVCNGVSGVSCNGVTVSDLSVGYVTLLMKVLFLSVKVSCNRCCHECCFMSAEWCVMNAVIKGSYRSGWRSSTLVYICFA